VLCEYLLSLLTAPDRVEQQKVHSLHWIRFSGELRSASVHAVVFLEKKHLCSSLIASHKSSRRLFRHGFKRQGVCRLSSAESPVRVVCDMYGVTDACEVCIHHAMGLVQAFNPRAWRIIDTTVDIY